MKISVFGSGYVGVVTGASLANLGHEVLCVDMDAQKISVLQQGSIPFFEPGLRELVSSNMQHGRLRFSSNLREGVGFGEALFNCVGTPEQANGAADLSFVFSVTELVARHTLGYKVLINKSTVPPGTAAQCTEIILKQNPSSEVEVVSNPEFLKQGNAVYDFNHPDKIVLGARSGKALEVVRRVYHGLIKMYIPVIETSWETAEMIKYANNSFLATKISFINEIANICDRVGADVTVVAKAMGMDQRIGPKFLNAGIGYGGSCFPKDLKALRHTAEDHGYTAHLLREVDSVNERQKAIFIPFLLDQLHSVGGTTVTIWGLSFKPKTSDLRGATSLVLIEKLLHAGMNVKVYDPVSAGEMRKIVGAKVEYASSLDDSVSGSNLIILVTEWDEFRNVDFAHLGSLMKTRIMFDGRNIYEPEQMKRQGFEYYGVGRR